MRPSPFLLKWIATILALAVWLWLLRIFPSLQFAGASPEAWRNLVVLLTSATVLLAAADYFFARRHIEISVTRTVVGGFSQGARNTYGLTVSSHAPWRIPIRIREGLPPSLESNQEDVLIDTPPGESFLQEVTVTPARRGDFVLEPAWVMAGSRWGFWEMRLRRGGTTKIQVYPNFAILQGGLETALEHRIQQLGVHPMQRRGRGMDFLQLREFVYGDSPQQVDWKATSRFNRPIVREFQDERDQRIFFLLDGGHRMRAMAGEFSLFDHAVNAMLIASFVALRQGDSVGLVSFAGKRHWIQPVKGQQGMKSLLNQTYSLQSSTDTSDYIETASEFMQKQPKRSLVVLLTSLRDDDLVDLQTTTRLLRKNHLVLIVTIAEPFLEGLDDMPIDSGKSARQYASMAGFRYSGTRLLARLRADGVSAVESGVTRLNATITREYLRVKRAGRI
jgi:uncharacterized protein (DUF58 family)